MDSKQPAQGPVKTECDCPAVGLKAGQGIVWGDARWIGLRNLIRVCTERNGPCGRQRTVSYYISSLPADAKALLEYIRGHWAGGGERPAPHPGRAVPGGRLMSVPGHELAVMGILRRVVLNMVRTVQQNFRQDVSIVLLRDRIGRHPWILAATLP